LTRVTPLLLPPNLVERPYRGGSRLAAFRRAAIGNRDRIPEDWIGSTTSVFGQGDVGLTRLPDGSWLRDAVRAEPEAYLGSRAAAVTGGNPGLLVKLIDAQQRLSVHLHPDRGFARRRLGQTFGKTEAWYVLEAQPGAAVHFGFREAIDARELLHTVEAGEGGSLLGKLNRVEVASGDVIFVPAGTPHAIGEGIFLLEVQEPSDLLVRLEWSGYVVAGMPNDLGLGFSVALEAVDRSAWDAARLETVIRRATVAQDDARRELLPPQAAPYFRLGRIHDGAEPLDAGFTILIVVKGSGALRTADGIGHQLAAGDCWLIAWQDGPIALEGDLEAIRCRPADPSIAAAADPDLSSYLAPSASGGKTG
jgi:mannose-6-phosphate isomerase